MTPTPPVPYDPVDDWKFYTCLGGVKIVNADGSVDRWDYDENGVLVYYGYKPGPNGVRG